MTADEAVVADLDRLIEWFSDRSHWIQGNNWRAADGSYLPPLERYRHLVGATCLVGGIDYVVSFHRPEHRANIRDWLSAAVAERGWDDAVEEYNDCHDYEDIMALLRRARELATA